MPPNETTLRTLILDRLSFLMLEDNPETGRPRLKSRYTGSDYARTYSTAADMTDAELLEYFERVVRRYYVQR